MNASITMEDPFDGRGVDNIYIDEPLSECEHVILMDEDAELETAVQEFLAKPGGEDERDDMEQGFGSTGQRGAVDAHEGNEPKQPCTLDAAQTEEHSLLQDDHSSLAHSDSLEDAASGLVVSWQRTGALH